jgi:hypothetical protein
VTLEARSELDHARRLLATVIPEHAQQHGWGVANIGHSWVTPDHGGEPYEVWHVDLIGPTEVDERPMFFAGQASPMFQWRIVGGSMGSLSAFTPETLAAQVDKWIRDVGLKP